MEDKSPQKDVSFTPDRDEKGRFNKGFTANPGGRPQGSVSLVTLLKEHLILHPEDAKSIIEGLVKMGKSRDLYAIKEIVDRVDGKVTETHRLESDSPITLVFMPAREVIEGDNE